MSDEGISLYRLYGDGGTLLYVGITSTPKQRFMAHINKGWWGDVRDINLELYNDRAAAEKAEQEAIQREQPLHNVAHNGAPEAVERRVLSHRSNSKSYDPVAAAAARLQQARRLEQARLDAFEQVIADAYRTDPDAKLSDLAERASMSPETIRRALIRQQVPLRPRGRRLGS